MQPATHLIKADSLFGPAFWEPFAAIGRRRGIRYVVLCTHESHVPLYASRPDLFERVTCVDGLYRDAVPPPASEHRALTQFLRRFEDETGTLAMDVLQADRHLGRGTFPGGSGHPRSRLSDRGGYWTAAALTRDLSVAYGEILREERVDVVLSSGIASLPGKVLFAEARRHGAATRMIGWTRLRNRWTWTTDEFESMPTLPNAYRRRLEEGLVPSETPRLSAYDENAREKRRLADMTTGAGSTRRMARELKLEAKTLVAIALGRRRRKAAGYYLRENLAYLRRVRLQALAYRRLADPSWSLPRLEPYVFIPLQVEPEGSLSVLSPEFTHQAALVDMVVKALPAGVRAVVKEHVPAFGRRPVGFYEAIAALPMLSLAPDQANGADLGRGALATVTISGTTGFEAAVAGVPVVAFGRHNFYAAADHVHEVHDACRLREVFRALLDEGESGAEQRRIQGFALLRAVEDLSVDFGDEGPRTGRPLPAELLERLHELLDASLRAAVG